MDSGGVDDMFSSLGEKLGWFQFEDIDSALKFLNSKSAKKKKKDNKPKKNSTSTKKNIQNPDSAGHSLSFATTREKSACTSPSTTTNVADLKEIFTGSFLLERDCEKINFANTSAVVKKQTGKENAQVLLEKYNLSLSSSSSSSSSITQVKDSFDVNNPNISQRLFSNTFSDDSVANITSGICKKIQFNSDESSLFDSKLEQSTSSSSSNVGDSFEGKLSLEKTTSVLSTSSDSNNQSRTSNQFNTGSKLETDIGKIKIEDEYVDVSDDDDDDLENFLQKMLTPHKTSVGDSTNKQSGLFDLSKIEHQKMLDSCSDLSSDTENNENVFNEIMSGTNHKRYDGTERKTNACTPTVKEIPKQSQKWVLQAKHSIDNLSSQSESCNSSSDDDDSDFEAFLEKMKNPVKETPHWLPEDMKEFIVSSSDESSDEGEESLSLYHRIRISPEIDKFSLFGTNTMKSSTHERGNLNDDKDKTGFPFLTPKVKPSTEFKKPSINFPQTEIKKAPEIKPRSRFLEVTPKGTSTSELKKHLQTCPNLKSNELALKIRSNQPAENYASFLKSLSIGAATNLVDPSARKYINHFKQYQVELVSKLFKIYNDTVFDGRFPVDFSICWNKRLLTTAGHCILKSKYTNNRKECQRNAEIRLATKVCDTPERVRDTLIHEMCHAAVWVFNGSRENHGRLWKAWARKANYAHPYLPLIKRCHSYNIATKYTYRCVQCGYSFGRHSKSLDTAKKVCGYCKGQFEVLLSNTSGRTMISTPARALSKFALFVKEHYGTVKKHEKCSHKDVMEKLSAQFRQAQI